MNDNYIYTRYSNSQQATSAPITICCCHSRNEVRYFGEIKDQLFEDRLYIVLGITNDKNKYINTGIKYTICSTNKIPVAMNSNTIITSKYSISKYHTCHTFVISTVTSISIYIAPNSKINTYLYCCQYIGRCSCNRKLYIKN